jgi:hypothetical protein
MALRMGGQSPHLGMCLTEGSLACYSIERNLENQSNDRGVFLLHPSPMELEPGETRCIGWVIFPHDGKEDFRKKLTRFPHYVQVEADQYVLFQGEKCKITIRPSFTASHVTVNGQTLEEAEGLYHFTYEADTCGEKVFDIYADTVHTWCRILVQPPIAELAKKRCFFIEEHQQYKGKNDCLSGAFLIYDNEEKHVYYNRVNDYNGGRERVGMGVLIARYLQVYGKELDQQEGSRLATCLKKYTEYLKREILNLDTGEICNDLGQNNHEKRLYNFPWYMTYFTELYRLNKEKENLKIACRILENYYRQGGGTFYAIELPVCALCEALEDAGMELERRMAEKFFTGHADYLVKQGLHYPPSEVNYEQSIVAPAASILLQVYKISGNKTYLEAGKLQLKVLEQFNGIQPDYHLYETAIRHWDGFWFGKKELFGDTFPHYWSGLTGSVYQLYAELTGDDTYKARSEASLRGVLPLFFPDGTASCAYVFPRSVNGIQASYFDPYANDQDWGLYFYLRNVLS